MVCIWTVPGPWGMLGCARAHLLPPALIEQLHPAAQGLDGLLEPSGADQILQVFQHPLIVLRLPLGLHHGNLLHLPLGKQNGSAAFLNLVFFWGVGKYSERKIYAMTLKHCKKRHYQNYSTWNITQSLRLGKISEIKSNLHIYLGKQRSEWWEISSPRWWCGATLQVWPLLHSLKSQNVFPQPKKRRGE